MLGTATATCSRVARDLVARANIAAVVTVDLVAAGPLVQTRIFFNVWVFPRTTNVEEGEWLTTL